MNPILLKILKKSTDDKKKNEKNFYDNKFLSLISHFFSSKL